VLLSFPALLVGMVALHNLTQRGQRRAKLYAGDAFPADTVIRRLDRPPPKPRPTFPDAIRSVDPHFSGALFRDHVLLVYTRAVALVVDRSAEAMLDTLLNRRSADTLRGSLLGWRALGLVTIGHHTVSVRRAHGTLCVDVTFFSNITATPPDGSADVLLEREERWTFARPPGALSPEPARLRTLGCHGCGSTADPGLDGRCPACGAPRTEGAPQWRVVELEVVYSDRAPSPELPMGGGKEPGLERSTVFHSKLRKRRADFLARHPDLDLNAELQRMSDMFVQLQQAWTKDAWEEARPLMSDALFTANQGWLDQLKRAGLRNRTVGVKVSKVELCDVAVDVWVEVLTVRIFASCLDWTERVDGGGVVGGSARQRREFSEYWTFMRSVGARRKTADLQACPSCGAPLDKMSMAGVCGYCESKVTAGDYDWVATRIAQDDDVDSLG